MSKQIINYTDMDSNKKELAMIFDHINQILDNVETTCTSIVSSEIWNGRAANYYEENSKAICDNFEDINYELKSIINYLEKVIDSYQNLEKSIINSISN